MAKFYEYELEALSRERLSDHQHVKLQTLMKELATNPFYSERLAAAGIDPTNVKHYDDLALLPFTTKGELAGDQLANPPFGRLLTYPLSRYRYFHQTSGTTGKPLRWVDTEDDWETWIRCWQRVYRAAGVTEDDVVFCAFSFGPYISHWLAISSAWRVGAMCIAGGGMNSEQRLRTIIDNKCTVLVCTPTYALHLAEVAAGLGLDLRSSSIRIGIHAGEPGASIPNVKRRIQDAWGLTCFDHAGATEVGAWAFECQAQCGAIHLNESEFIFEVVDSRTCRPAPEGTCGELVITNLGRPGMPVLRYRTGDLVVLTTEPCPCGSSFARIKGGIVGRADDMMIVRGMNIYPSAIDNVMRSIPDVVEYEVEIRRASGMDDLVVRAELAQGSIFGMVRHGVLNRFRAELNIRVTLEEAPPNSLPRYEFKARRYKRIEPESA